MSDANVDRNLLLGILAINLNFITQQQLTAAMQAWTADKSKPLRDVLREQQALDDEHLRLLEALMQKHLERHGGDAAQSLAALSSVDPAVEDLTHIGDTQVAESLVHVTRAGKTVRPQETLPITDEGDAAVRAAAPGDASPIRFRVLRPHAQGGLGQISVARDEELHREVAFKELHDRHAENAGSRSRFILEAEITGALEHPGIVPIYGLGQYGDGRPFYAMRFIRGDSLAEAIDRYYQGEEKMDAGRRELEFRKLLRRFVDVCNAMQYAHSRGVLHRDLKPGNIMLGKYGETLVVDWGLAKPLLDKSPDVDPEEGAVQLSSDSLSSPTLMGSVVGTPQYMSPEQAAGNLEQVGTAADVYSLGATLYCVLTGEPPISSDELARLLRRVREGDFPPPCEVNRNVPAPLNAICVKAMALAPEDRYGQPIDIADDVEHWLADEPVSVHDESLLERAGRWARRHRSWVAAAAVACVLITIVSVVAALLVNQARRAEQRQKEIAQRAQQQAESNFQIASRAVDEMLMAVGVEHLADAPQMQQVRKQLLTEALGYYDSFRRQDAASDSRYQWQIARANHYAGYILRTIPARQDEAVASLRQAIDQLKKLAEQFPDETKYRRQMADSYNWLGELFRPTDPDNAAEAYRNATRLQREILGSSPGNRVVQRELARSLMNRGILLAERDQFAEARDAYNEAIGRLQSLPEPATTERLQELARCQNNRAKLLADNNQLEPSRQDYQDAVDTIDRALVREPFNRQLQQERATYLNNLANVLQQIGELARAAQISAQAVAQWKALAAPVGSIGDELANSYNSLGAVLQRQSRQSQDDDAIRSLRSEAARVYADSARLFRDLIQQAPNQPALRDRLGNSLYNQATLLYAQQQLREAAELLDQAIASHRQAVSSNPESPEFRTHLRNDLWMLAELNLKAGDHAQAAVAAVQLPPLFPDESDEYLRAARFLARCFVSAEKDEALDGSMRQQLKQQYAKQAVDLLRAAIQHGLEDVASLKKTEEEGGDFYMLLEREDFQALE